MAALAEKARPAGEVDRVAPRELRRDDPRPRPRHVPRGRREARRHDHGAEGEDVREPRRRPLHDRARASRRRCTAACSPGRYRIPSIHCQRLGVYTNTGDGRRLPRRRPARGDLRRRARDGPRRARARRRPGRGAAAELHPARRVPVRPGHPRRAPLRQRRVRQGARPRARDRRLRRLPRRAGRGAARGPLPRHRLLDLRRDLRRRAVGLDRHDRPGLGRRPVGERERARPPDRQGRRHDRLAAARAGPRDDDGAGRRRRARHPARGRRRSSTATRRARRSATAPTAAAAPRSARSPSTTRCSGSRRRRRRIGAAHARGRRPRTSTYEDGQVVREGLARPRRRRSRRSPPRPRSATACRRATSRSSTTRPTTTRRTARSRSARTSRWSRSTPRPAR